MIAARDHLAPGAPATTRPPAGERPADVVLPLALALARFAARRQREADSRG